MEEQRDAGYTLPGVTVEKRDLKKRAAIFKRSWGKDAVDSRPANPVVSGASTGLRNDLTWPAERRGTVSYEVMLEIRCADQPLTIQSSTETQRRGAAGSVSSSELKPNRRREFVGGGAHRRTRMDYFQCTARDVAEDRIGAITQRLCSLLISDRAESRLELGGEAATGELFDPRCVGLDNHTLGVGSVAAVPVPPAMDVSKY